MSTPDAIASSYLDDVTLTIDNSEPMLAYVRATAIDVRRRHAAEDAQAQADALGQALVDWFGIILNAKQQQGPLGDLLRQVLGHVDIGDLGSYYLRDLKGYLTELNATLQPD